MNRDLMNKPCEAMPAAVLSQTDSIVEVTHYGARRYDAASEVSLPGPEQLFDMEMHDQRRSAGFAFVTLASKEGNIDDSLGVRVEVAHLPGTDIPVQCVHIHIADELCLSIYKQADRLVLRPEANVSVRQDGEGRYLVD